MSPYLEDDVVASRRAREKLRQFNDNDLAWMPHLSPTHLQLLCDHFECTPYIFSLAVRYEMHRRKAFPKRLTP